MIEDLILILTQNNHDIREIALNNLHWQLDHELHPDLEPKYDDLSKALYITYRALKVYDDRQEARKC